MNLEKYTQKSQEAILAAQQLAQEYQHQVVEPIHLLLALVQQEDGIVPAIITKVFYSSVKPTYRSHASQQARLARYR